MDPIQSEFVRRSTRISTIPVPDYKEVITYADIFSSSGTKRSDGGSSSSNIDVDMSLLSDERALMTVDFERSVPPKGSIKTCLANTDYFLNTVSYPSDLLCHRFLHSHISSFFF